MSVWRRQYRTDRRLWLMCGLVAFGILGALLRVPFGKGEEVVFWQLAWFILRYHGNPITWVSAGPLLLFWCLPLASVAAAWGWVAQAVVRVIWPRAEPPAAPAR